MITLSKTTTTAAVDHLTIIVPLHQHLKTDVVLRGQVHCVSLDSEDILAHSEQDLTG